MIYIAIASITILFFTFAFFITPLIKKLANVKICAICAASSLTWLALLILRHFNILEIDSTLIGVLMGGSVVGIMYSLEKYFKSNNVKHFWFVRLLEITGGFYFAYSVAIRDANMILIGIAEILTIFVITIMLISKTDKNKLKAKRKEISDKRSAISDKEKQNAIKKLEESLEDCC
ncbi:hypothetical protein ACFLY9_00785 [Patescibacteria group bacterium]